MSGSQSVSRTRSVSLNHLSGLPQFVPLSYIDTVAIWTDRVVSRAFEKTTKAHCGHLDVRVVPMKFRKHFKCRLQLHQPKRAAIQLINELDHESVLVNQVHVALDLVTRTWLDAERLSEKLRPMIVQPWNTHRRLKIRENTRYSHARQWNSLNVVDYSDRPSKVLPMPAMHIEFRANGAAVVQQWGISCLSDLLEFNACGLVKRKLRIYSINERLLGKTLAKSAGINLNSRNAVQEVPLPDGRRLLTYDRIGRTAQSFLRGFCLPSTERYPFAQILLQKGRERGLDLANCIRKHETDAFLPVAYGYIEEVQKSSLVEDIWMKSSAQHP